MKRNGDSDRLRNLAVAFHDIAQTTPELSVDPPVLRTVPSAPSQVRSMFRVRLRSATGEARARMYVHDRGAKVETQVVDSAGEAKRAAKDDLPIDLRRGYRWEEAVFDDAKQMAEVLYKHMTRQLEAAAGRAS